MQQVASGIQVVLAEKVDGGGEVRIQRIDALVVIGQQGGVEIEEILVDAPRHVLVRAVKPEGSALEQAGAELDEAVPHTVDCHTIGNIAHPEGFRHLFVG